MARIKEQVLGVVKTPPSFSSDIIAVGGVTGVQDYDASTDTYSADYTQTPLTLDPSVGIIDLDAPLSSVDGRPYLANMHWYELDETGAATEITVTGTASTPAGYTQLDNTEGSATAGRLQVAKNAAPGSPIRLRFAAQCVYGQDIFDIVKDTTVKCRDRTPAVSCMFDVADIVSYNPIHDGDRLPIQLTVLENNSPCPSSRFIPVWETRETDGTWREYGTEPYLDYWLDIAADKMSAELVMKHMGYGCSVRVRLKYDRGGNPSSVTLQPDDLSVPFCRFECTRTLGDWDDRMVKATSTLGAWVEEVRPEVIFKDSKGDIQNPDRFFRVTFYACAPGKTLSASDKVGEGRTVTIRTSKGNASGLKIGYAVDEYTPLLPLKVTVNGEDRILCVDGHPLIARTIRTD